MLAGALDRVIKLQSVAYSVDDLGTPTETWTDFATVRAQLVQASTTEYLKTYGETETAADVFRIRWLDGVTDRHQIVYNGNAYNIRQVTEIGRRVGLELRAEIVRAEVG